MNKLMRVSITTPNSITRAIKALEEYRDSLSNKCVEFTSRLMDVGILTAKANEGQYAGMIRFEKKFDKSENGCDAVLIATDGQKITRAWYRNGEPFSVQISPLLMAEFGSGWLANVLDDVEGVGQGTFEDGDYKQKHAFDIDGWCEFPGTCYCYWSHQ